MRSLLFAILVCALCALAPACPPPMPPAPPDVVVVDASVDLVDAADDDGFDSMLLDAHADFYLLGCTKLHKLACVEGADVPLCASVFRQQDGRTDDLRMKCVAGSRSKAAVRACGPAWAHSCAGP